MEVIHNIGRLSIKRGVNENVGFLLTNKNGSYCSFFSAISSKYHGFFCFDAQAAEMYKLIESIEIVGQRDVSLLKNGFYFAERKKGSAVESFLMPKNFDSLVYELSSEEEIDLFLDCKLSYDNRQWGRHYSISKEDGCLIIKFTKKTDIREDASNEKEEFTLYLAVKSDESVYKLNCEWVKREYLYDKERKSCPFERHVYNALRLKGARFVFSAAKSKKDAITECRHVFNNIDNLKIQEKRDFLEFLKNYPIKKILKNKQADDCVKLAYISAFNSLDSLIFNGAKAGIFAGLPWFFQFWSRDALVSMKAVCKANPFLAKKIISGCLRKLEKDGRLSNILWSCKQGAAGSADSHGWLFLRCSELQKILGISSADIKNSLEMSINGLLKFHTKNSFEANEENETWMDAGFEDDSRKGARVEVQALRLSMYSLMFHLTKNQKYKILENLLKTEVRQKFWNGEMLADGLDDFTARPNIFIAAYAYPELLSDSEWESCFENALKCLWLDWGGLSTIDKNNKLYTETSTGEDKKSYHRGDSWFWINNLAALMLNKIDNKINKSKFNENIKKIVDASTKEILWKGCIGCHAELSDAKQLSSKGCFNQAWSNAMYIEMVDEVFS